MVEINLLPAQYRKQSGPNIWKYATWALVPVTAAALLIPWIMTATKTSDLQKQIDAIQGDIDALTPQKHQYDELTAQHKELEQVTTIAQTLRDQKTYWSNDIAAFSTQLPASSGVGLTKMDITSLSPDNLAANQKNGIYTGKNVRRQISLDGKATSEQAVINFLNTFENSPNFGVRFTRMERQTEDNSYTFSADVGIVGSAPAAQAAVNSSVSSDAPGTTSAQPTAPAISPAARTADATGDTNVK